MMVRTWVDGLLLCRLAECIACASAPEFIAVHYDCFHIFRECSRQAFKLDEREVLDRLWTVGSCRNPWPRAEHIHLAEEGIDRPAFERIAMASGLFQLRRLPQELVGLIRGFSRHELFWRSVSVVFLSSEGLQRHSFSRIPLDQVLSWNRGDGSFARASSSPLPPNIRLTIDLRGISRVERLHERPPYTGNDPAVRSVAFIVQPTSHMRHIYAEFRNGLLRLCLPKNHPGLRIWNTPSPPDLVTCKLLNPSAQFIRASSLYSRLYAIDLNRARGLTFFFSSGRLFGTYFHRSDESTAIDTYEHFSRRPRRTMAWIYMPIAPADRVLVLGSRKTDLGFNVLVRTKLVGEIILGPLGIRSEPDRLLGYGSSITLIYGEPKELEPASVLGAYCSLRSKDDDDVPRPFSIQDFKPEIAGDYFSWAPLSEIQSIRTFYDTGTGLCRGIIFHYENGGLRAVGQCRRNIDRSTLTIRPSMLCFQPTSYRISWGLERHGVRVEIGANAAHRHIDDGWKCLPLVDGVLTFSFTNDSAYISHQIHLPGENGPTMEWEPGRLHVATPSVS